MLNKKAIAALAAGATLVSGLAFATPSFAACPANPPLMSVAKAATKAAHKAYSDAKAVLEAMTVPAEPTDPTDPAVKAFYEKLGEVYVLKADAQGTGKNYEAAKAFVDGMAAHKKALDAKNAQQTKVNELKDKYVEAQDAEDCATPDPTKDELNRAEIKKVYDAKQDLDNKEDILNKKQKAFDGAFKALNAATAEFKARKAAVDAAKAAIDKFDASGVNDSAARDRLVDVYNRAVAHLVRVSAALGDAQNAYDDALKDVKKAVDEYNKALEYYKAVYNEAIAMGINPALLPAVVTADPLAPNFPTVPGARDLYSKSLSGEFGKDVQAAAKKTQKAAPKKGEAKKEAGKNGAAAPAGAKLDTKAAAAASAAPLSKTGVTVMFTALAASMLAGIGAAVRKFRH
ncbi:hypothetical protein [Gardnerella sp. KA00255]|uniref:hypothetical protein n=1 Tax=Gardnerella sp. KA00255 TaxID=2749073 RepID=UPI003BAA8063